MEAILFLHMEQFSCVADSLHVLLWILITFLWYYPELWFAILNTYGLVLQLTPNLNALY